MMPFLPLTRTFGALCRALSAGSRRKADADHISPEGMASMRRLVPPSAVELEAEQQYQEIKRQASRYNALAAADHPQLRRLRCIADKLIPHANRWNPHASSWQWEVNLIGSRDINAFCMPGGKIAFFSGILGQLQLTEDELAIVMGHEMAHALRDHGRGRLMKNEFADAGARLAGLGLSALLGLDRSTAAAAGGSLADFAMLKSARDDEAEADRIGLELAARAGFDPRAGVALWLKMDRQARIATPQWLSTHPSVKSRVAEIQKQIPYVLPLFESAVGKRSGRATWAAAA